MNQKTQPEKSAETAKDKEKKQAECVSKKIDLVFKNTASAERNIKNLINSSSNPIDMANKMSSTLKVIELIQMTCYKYKVVFKGKPPLFVENKLNSDLRTIDRIEKIISGMLLTESKPSGARNVH